MDSRALSYQISVDMGRKADGEIDTAAPECEIDHTIMSQDRLVVKFEHNTKVATLRGPKFHSEEVVTTVGVLVPYVPIA